MIPEDTKISFPLWQYLNQPLLGGDKPPIFNPQRFAQMYRIEFLKRCWSMECDAKGQL